MSRDYKYVCLPLIERLDFQPMPFGLKMKNGAESGAKSGAKMVLKHQT